MKFPWRKSSVPRPKPLDPKDGIEAKEARHDAEAKLRDVLDKQAEIHRVVHDAEGIRLRNHLGEALEQALRRRAI